VCVAALLFCAQPSNARAEQPVQAEAASDERDARKLRLLVGAGYGAQDDSDAGSFGPAFALRASYALVGALHLGAQGTFHIGSQFGGELNRVQYYGLEAGLSLSLSRATLTPYVTGGIAFISSQRNTHASLTTWYYGLGALLDFAAPDYLLLGVDARFVLFPRSIVQADNIGMLSTVDLLLMFGVLL
jgi:hypothetical protein